MKYRSTVLGLVAVSSLTAIGATACSDGGGGGTPTAGATGPVASPSSTSATPAVTAPAATVLEDAAIGARVLYPSSYSRSDTFDAGNGTIEVALASAGSTATRDLAPGAVYVTIRVARNDKALSLDDWAADGGTESSADKVLETEETTVAGQRAIRITAAPGIDGPRANSIITYVAHEGQVYSMWLFPGSPEALEAHRAEYDAIVASFEFLD